MQTDIAVHNTNQKETNVMNHNPNCGNNRKEKKMSAPSKTEVSELEATNLVKG